MELENLPADFLTRLQSILSAEDYPIVVKSFSHTTPTAFRINTLKANNETIASLHVDATPVSWHPHAYTIPPEQREQLLQSDAFQKGEIYIQGLSSMLVPLILGPQPGEEVLDLTAAPGSKTSQIAALMNNQGRLAAVEKVKSRFFKLRNNLEHLGVSCAHTYLKDGTLVGKAVPNRFDRVLLDAPCSSEGRFDSNDPESFKYWSERKIKEMSRKQWRLLVSALQALKPGGVLVYSTCTFAPEENEVMIAKLLKKYAGQIKIESIEIKLDNMREGLTQWQGKSFPEEIKKCVRVLPNDSMGGFFICRLRSAPGLLPVSYAHLK